MEEVDMNVEITEALSESSKYNTNFGYDATFETIVKLGIKFGASTEHNQGVTFTRKYSEVSDDLGETYVFFGDNVIIDEAYSFNVYRKYSLGSAEITVRPRRVQ